MGSLGRIRRRRVHLCSRGNTRPLLWIVAVIRVRALVHCCARRGGRVHSSVRGFARAHPVVVGFIEFRVGLLGRV